jgi:DNA-binding MarR family transcriptional regulator
VPEPAQLELGSYLPYLVNRVGVAIVEGFSSEALKREGLTIYMWRVLAVLANRGEQRQVDLADMTSIDAPTISRLVTRLASAGLATRSRSVTSNREVGVALTPKGASVVRRLIPSALAWEDRATAGMSAKEVVGLKRSLAKMYENLAATD